MLAILLALLCDPGPCAYSYSLRATGIVETPTRSCGAARTMLAERHLVTVDGDEFYVDGRRWEAEPGSALPGEAYLTRANATVWLYANDNQVVGLYALQGDGCRDIVRVEGVRR